MVRVQAAAELGQAVEQEAVTSDSFKVVSRGS
jgi:hypothetical protein